MALSNQHQLQMISLMVEALSSSECRTLVYLCESLDTDDSVTFAKEMLQRKVTHEKGQLFMPALTLHLRRYDILRKVFKTSREEVERDPEYRRVLSAFRVLMVNISEDMTKDDLNNLKFLLGNTLSRDRIEKAKNFLDVIIELEKLDKISPESVNLVEESLRHINRIDLAKRVANYKTPVATPEQHSSHQQRCRAPCPLATPNGSHSVQQPGRVQFRHTATANMAAPVYIQQNCQIPSDWYKFNTNPRGVCLIIDCVGNDGDMLEQTFRALHFNVVLYKWLSVHDTLSALRVISRQRENLNGDGFACCIISRGTRTHLLCTDYHSTDLPLDSVRSLFTCDACPMLAGKPKMFFIQSYSVPEFQHCHRMHHRDEDLETDGCDGMSTYGYIPKDADVFWSHCWTDDRQLEQGHHRSIYLKALTDGLQKGQRRKTKLVDIHTEVNGVVFEHNKRNPGENYRIDLKHTLRKDLYF